VGELTRAMERQGLDMKVTALVSKLICRLFIISSIHMPFVLCVYNRICHFRTHSLMLGWLS